MLSILIYEGLSEDFRLHLSDSIVSHCPGSVHYDEGESEAESIHHSMDMSTPIFQLYEAVRGGRNSQGQLISEPFLQLPSRKDYPDYFQQISQPISLQQIRYKMKNNEYESVEQLDADLTLMFENAKRYNVPHSSIYKRVLKLQHIQQLRREDDSMDRDSMLSSTMSDTGSTKRKRSITMPTSWRKS